MSRRTKKLRAVFALALAILILLLAWWVACNRPRFKVHLARDEVSWAPVPGSEWFTARITNTGKEPLRLDEVQFEWRGAPGETNSHLRILGQTIEPGTATITRCEIPSHAKKFRVIVAVRDKAGGLKKKLSEVDWKSYPRLSKPFHALGLTEKETLHYYRSGWQPNPFFSKSEKNP